MKMDKSETILIQDGNTVIELTGADKEAFLADRAAMQVEQEARKLVETERATKLASAITKLKALGLTETEAKIIIGIE
jgi:hypothetical protein